MNMRVDFAFSSPILANLLNDGCVNLEGGGALTKKQLVGDAVSRATGSRARKGYAILFLSAHKLFFLAGLSSFKVFHLFY